MQKARAEFGAGRDVATVADRHSHRLQRVDMRRIVIDISEQRDVVARLAAGEMRLQPGAEIAVSTGLAQGCVVGAIGIDGNAVDGGYRLLVRQLAGLLERCREFASLDLRGLDVGLIERIDSEHRAGYRGCDFEAEEFLPDMLDRRQHDADHRMAGFLQRREFRLMRRYAFAFRAHVDEDAIVAVDHRIAERFAVNRNQAPAVLAGGFGDELFRPRAEVGNFGRRQHRHLVAALKAGATERKTKLHAGIFLRRHIGPTGANHRLCEIEQAREVDAGRRRRHQAERRQHRIAAADGGIAEEGAGEALLFCDLLQ